MRIMTNCTTRGRKLILSLVVLAVLAGCQSGPTKIQDAQNIEESRPEADQADTAEVASTPSKRPPANPSLNELSDQLIDGLDTVFLVCSINLNSSSANI